jgi:hypothetical protein
MKFASELENWRVHKGPLASNVGDDFGAFFIPGPHGRTLRVIASSGTVDLEWEHVSVSLPTRCPNWPEMCFIKRLFWSEEEVVMQLHPAKSNWVNNHNYCLHLWRPLKESIPLPPSIAVGDKSLGILHA